ncbi:hypothetical protein [Streptomyces tsukubensis]
MGRAWPVRGDYENDSASSPGPGRTNSAASNGLLAQLAELACTTREKAL